MKPFCDEATLRRLLQQVKAGERSIEQAIAALQPRPLAADLGFATIDHDRARRCGFPEVVFCQGKEPTQAAAIAVEIMTRADRLLMTRAGAAHADAVRTRLPAARYHERARCLTIEPAELAQRGLVAVVSAGTSDLPVADEAAVTLRLAGNRVEQFTDIGIAGSAPSARAHRRDPRCQRDRRRGRHGGCSALRGGRSRRQAGHRNTDERRLRRVVRRARRAARHAEFVRRRRRRGQH
jgi:NCAIR mutase (PurE)-related protein